MTLYSKLEKETNMNIGNQASNQKTTEINTATELLRRNIGELRQEVEQLGQRLEPVLRPSTPTVGCVKECNPPPDYSWRQYMRSRPMEKMDLEKKPIERAIMDCVKELKGG